MKDKAIVGNIGHFDNEADMAGLKKAKDVSNDQAEYLGVPLEGPHKSEYYRY